MKKINLSLLTLFIASVTFSAFAANDTAKESSLDALDAKLAGAPKEPAKEAEKPAVDLSKEETITRGGYTLKIVVRDPKVTPEIRQKFIEAFFTVYPKLVNEFNPNATKTVRFILRPDIDPPAYAGGGEVNIKSSWILGARGNDTDIVTHETMHLVQAYSRGGPGWITEGIADYVRNKFGVDNAANGWSMPELNKERHKYTDSYRVTARFFTWIENRVNHDAIKKLDGIMREGKYKNESTFKDLTGKTVDELWELYKNDPALTGKHIEGTKAADTVAPARVLDFKKNGYTLKITITDPKFPIDVANKMADTFFVVWPNLQKGFHTNGRTDINFVIQEKNETGGHSVPAYAYFHNGTVHFSSKWMAEKKGNDIDVITHELTHIAQSYPSKRGAIRPGWITEGIADYARYVYGVDNKGSGWEVPEINPNQKYTDSYRVTGRFFRYLDENVKKGLIVKLDDAMRDGTYTEEFWKTNTEKTVDELWADYVEKNPKMPKN